MLLQDIPAGNGIARVQWDTAANKILVTNSYAERAGFKPIPAKYMLQVVSKKWEEVEGVMYEFELKRKDGSNVQVWGYGIEQITDPIGSADLSMIKSFFPHLPDQVFAKLDTKPLDILVGMNFFGLHPSGGEGKNRAGNLKALRSEFGSGWIIGGSHPSLDLPERNLTSKALAMITVCDVQINPYTEKGFWELESIGVEPPKRCGRCRNCKICSNEGLLVSCKEEEEHKMIYDNVTIADGITRFSFPFIKDPMVLSDNREPMLKRAMKLEQSLVSKGQLDLYNREFQKFLDIGSLIEVSLEEIRSYKGPKNYISHHGVLQPTKVTTPLRLVSNSSQDNRGHCLNDCLAKGRNTLADMNELMTRFRSYDATLV